MSMQKRLFVLCPSLREIGTLTMMMMCWVQLAQAEPCITCRTPHCSRKVGIVAWCGPGRDPKRVEPTGTSVTKRAAKSAATSRRAKKLVLEDVSRVHADAVATAESATPAPAAAPATALAEPPAAPSTSIPTSDSPLETTAIRPSATASDLMVFTTVPNVKALSLVRTEDEAVRRKQKKWIVAGAVTGGGLTLTATILAIVLTSLPGRCGAPVGTASLNGCN